MSRLKRVFFFSVAFSVLEALNYIAHSSANTVSMFSYFSFSCADPESLVSGHAREPLYSYFFFFLVD